MGGADRSLSFSALRFHFQNAFQITLGEPFPATDWDVKRDAGRIDGMLA
jgi:hypothetical protein